MPLIQYDNNDASKPQLAEEPEIDEDAVKHKPNFLALTVEKARNLVSVCWCGLIVCGWV